jgi:hypothetical protein
MSITAKRVTANTMDNRLNGPELEPSQYGRGQQDESCETVFTHPLAAQAEG